MSSKEPHEPRIYAGPGAGPELLEAIRGAGGRIVGPEEAEAVVWLGEDEDLQDLLTPDVRWVQLPSAGVEGYLVAGVVDAERVWTSTATAYGRAVAEHALALILAGRRRLAEAARARMWEALPGRPLDGATIAIVGAGGIGRALIELLAPWHVRIVAVTRGGHEIAGAALSLPAERLAEVWPIADVVVLCTPATAATAQMVGKEQLSAMREDALLVNVARGALVDTDALVDALATGSIGGAALDVTDPEPLPTGHPLWSEPRAQITPHVANPPAAASRAFAAYVAENVRRFAVGEPLLGRIELERGY